MSEKNLEKLLGNLGRVFQEKQFEQNISPHEFTDSYQDKKAKLLNSLAVEDRQKSRKHIGAAAAFVLLAFTSITVYAATQMITVKTTENESENLVTMDVNKNTGDYIPMIEITPQYLPERYAQWMEGKYSFSGERGADGITILDAGYYKNYAVPDVSDYEEMQIGAAKAVIINRDGYGYSWQIYLFYEETGHVILVYGCDALSKEEVIKVCENLTYREAPEKDPDHTYQAFAYEEVETGVAEPVLINSDALMAISEAAPCMGVTEDGEIPKDIHYSVKSIEITDAVNKEMLNADTTSDYDQVMEYIQEDGTLKSYNRAVNEWNNNSLEEKEIGTVSVKNVVVTMEVKNNSDQDYGDINIQPMWTLLKEDGNGYEGKDESDMIAGYEPGENFRGMSSYGISYDGMAYYFDSSAYTQSSHFYNMSIDAGETKEVQQWFAIPEDLLQNAYLSFSPNIEDYERYVKIQD